MADFTVKVFVFVLPVLIHSDIFALEHDKEVIGHWQDAFTLIHPFLILSEGLENIKNVLALLFWRWVADRQRVRENQWLLSMQINSL